MEARQATGAPGRARGVGRMRAPRPWIACVGGVSREVLLLGRAFLRPRIGPVQANAVGGGDSRTSASLPSGLQNRQAVATPRLDGSIPSPLRRANRAWEVPSEGTARPPAGTCGSGPRTGLPLAVRDRALWLAGRAPPRRARRRGLPRSPAAFPSLLGGDPEGLIAPVQLWGAQTRSDPCLEPAYSNPTSATDLLTSSM